MKFIYEHQYLLRVIRWYLSNCDAHQFVTWSSLVINLVVVVVWSCAIARMEETN